MATSLAGKVMCIPREEKRPLFQYCCPYAKRKPLYYQWDQSGGISNYSSKAPFSSLFSVWFVKCQDRPWPTAYDENRVFFVKSKHSFGPQDKRLWSCFPLHLTPSSFFPLKKVILPDSPIKGAQICNLSYRQEHLFHIPWHAVGARKSTE